MEWTQTTPQLKRRPSDDLLPQQRLSKRLETLSLRPKLLNIQPTDSISTSIEPSSNPKRQKKPKPPDAIERMDVDNVIYISDIDAELSSEDEEEPETKGKLVFVPDIERELTRIPHHVLRGRRKDYEDETGGRSKGQELVLYSVPRTLSVIEEKDSVRKAIIESRARLRDKQAAKQEARLNTIEEQENVQPQMMAPQIQIDNTGRFEGPKVGNGVIVEGFGAQEMGNGIVNGWYSGVNGASNGGGYDSDIDMDAMDIE